MGRKRYIRHNRESRDDKPDKKKQRVRSDEEEALAVFEGDTPSVSKAFEKNPRVQVVKDVEERDYHIVSSEESEISEDEPNDLMKLMTELGAASESQSSDEYDEHDDDSESESAEELLEEGESDLVEGESGEEDYAKSGEEDYAESCEEDDAGSGESDAANIRSDDSGSIDELSLDDSDPETQPNTAAQKAQANTATAKAQTTAEKSNNKKKGADTRESKPKRKKNAKALDSAVDPTGNAEFVYDDLDKKTLRETIEEGDIFSKHFEQDVDAQRINTIKDRINWKSTRVELRYLGACVHSTPPGADDLVKIDKDAPLQSVGVRNRLVKEIGKTLFAYDLAKHQKNSFLPFELDLFSVLNQYKDLMYTNETFENMPQIRHVYCLHALNHVLKTRLRVVINSHEKWSTKVKDQKREYRDQGFTRPKVLILAPFKESALRIVTMMISCLSTKKQSRVTGRKRFLEEYCLNADAPGLDPRKPYDFMQTFAGNTDDCFRFGLQLKRQGLSIFSNFYESDILVCSQLGLRLIIGADGDEKRDYDFMSSIEMVIIDQADVIYMQNWAHLLHCIDMLHAQPKDRRDTDFGRLRNWTADGYAKHYRQTLVFSGLHLPEVSAIFSKYCTNHAGEVRQLPSETEGTIRQIVVQVPIVFQKYPCTNSVTMADDRFHCFTTQVLPQYRERKRVLIFIPSYFDFVRIRNHLAKISFQCSIYSEYNKESGLRRARKEFSEQKTQFMLYTERKHFFERFTKSLKARHIIYYSLPTYPQFFPEMINHSLRVMQSGGEATCRVMFNKMEALKLASAVGTTRAQHLLSSEKNIFMFGAGE